METLEDDLPNNEDMQSLFGDENSLIGNDQIEVNTEFDASEFEFPDRGN